LFLVHKVTHLKKYAKEKKKKEEEKRLEKFTPSPGGTRDMLLSIT
jgi:hypothetical protein